MLKQRKDDAQITNVVTSGSGLSLTSGNWYTAKVVVDDDPNDANLRRLRFWVDTDDDGDYSDETTLLNTTAVDDDWSGGYVGLYKGNDTTVHQWDDFQVGLDNNDDGDIADAGDDILVSDDFNSNQVSLSYDNNGNLTNDGVYKFAYDAWNRLRKAILTDGSDETTIGAYEYYGDNRRAKKTVSNRGAEIVENDGGNTTVLFYYDRGWRIVETRNGSNQTTFQHLWGTRYIDELIWLEKNGDPTESNDTNPDDQSGESTADSRYFVHQDRNWNVVALSEYDPSGTNNGRIVERYSYTPYGSFVVLKGDSGSGELNAVGLSSTIGNPFAHQGLPFDQEKLCYQNRWREYDVSLQRFVQRDPLAFIVEGPFKAHRHYRGAPTLYAYAEASPLSNIDALGLAAFPVQQQEEEPGECECLYREKEGVSCEFGMRVETLITARVYEKPCTITITHPCLPPLPIPGVQTCIEVTSTRNTWCMVIKIWWFVPNAHCPPEYDCEAAGYHAGAAPTGRWSLEGTNVTSQEFCSDCLPSLPPPLPPIGGIPR